MTTVIISRVTSGYSITFRGGNFSPCVSTLKEFVGTYSRSYEPTTRRWSIDEDASAQLFQWLDYAHAELSARVEWQTPSDRKREGPPPPRQKAIDPYQTLHLLPSAPAELVKAAYRVMAALHHPDHGGDTEAMQRINDAYRRLAA